MANYSFRLSLNDQVFWQSRKRLMNSGIGESLESIISQSLGAVLGIRTNSGSDHCRENVLRILFGQGVLVGATGCPDAGYFGLKVSPLFADLRLGF